MNLRGSTAGSYIVGFKCWCSNKQRSTKGDSHYKYPGVWLTPLCKAQSPPARILKRFALKMWSLDQAECTNLSNTEQGWMKHRTPFPHGLDDSSHNTCDSLQNTCVFQGCSSLTVVASACIAEVHDPFVLFIFLYWCAQHPQLWDDLHAHSVLLILHCRSLLQKLINTLPKC